MYVPVHCAQPQQSHRTPLRLEARVKAGTFADLVFAAMARRPSKGFPCDRGTSRSGYWMTKATRSCPPSTRKPSTTCTRLSTRTSRVSALRLHSERLHTDRRPAFKKPPFRIDEQGWGEFDMTIVLSAAHKGGEHTLSHDLNFQSERYEAKHQVVRLAHHRATCCFPLVAGTHTC
jgi:hypothetical protein